MSQRSDHTSAKYRETVCQAPLIRVYLVQMFEAVGLFTLVFIVVRLVIQIRMSNFPLLLKSSSLGNLHCCILLSHKLTPARSLTNTLQNAR